MGTFEAYGSTVINGTGDSYREIAWSDWNALTPAQQQAIPKAVITDVPGVNGTVNADLFDVLWKNSAPTSVFIGQSIDLLGVAQYDRLILVYRLTSNLWPLSVEFSPTSDFTTYLQGASVSRTAAVEFLRSMTTAYKSGSTTDITVTFGDATQTPYGGTASTYNSVLIPQVIYGIKKSISLDITAVVANVSTDASKCMLSDGKSVESKLGSIDTPKLVATVYGDGVKTFAQLLNELFTAYGSSGLSLKYNSWLSVASDVYQYSGANYFTHHYVTHATFAAQQITLANPSTAYTWENGTVSDLGAIVPYNGYTVSLYA